MARLVLTFLGSLQVMLDDKPITAFRSVKVQGLLAYLVLTNHQSHSRDVLATLFWPDETDAVAKKNLRQSLYQLRQLLDKTASPEESYLLVTRSTVQFNPASDHSLDVTTFQTYLKNTHLEQAVALYKGELLPGLTCDSLPFEAWLREERERLHRVALDALYELCDRNLARGDYRTARTIAQRQLTLESWREEAHRQLIQALALGGERSAALAQYEACRVVLEEELGAEPSAETEALAARIRDQQAEWSGGDGPAHHSERRHLTIPFIGREDEHAILTRSFERARKDGLQVVVLLGEAGIGKTRLANHFLDWAATQGADILRSQAFETSEGLSYQPLTDALRQRLERENAPEDLLSDLWLTQLTRLLPELYDRYPDLPPPTQEESTARQHLFEAITRLVQALAERSPVVIFIDDWHWADAASMDVLHYAVLRWVQERLPILVLLTIRQEALTESPDLQSWLTHLKNHVSYRQLDLATLSTAETEQLIRILLAPTQENHDTPQPSQLTMFSRWLFKETDGQPFFLVETLKAMVEEGLFHPDTDLEAWHVDWEKFDDQIAEPKLYVSAGIREAIRNWLSRISAPAGELLTAAAVLGQQAAFDHLYPVAGLEEIQAVTALDELLVRQLLREDNERSRGPDRDPTYSFSHQKLGEVVYGDAGAARRRILHRRAFEVLQTTAAPAAELARHALHGGLIAETIQYSIAAGNEAMHLFAARVAIIHYETAWRLAEESGWPEAVSRADKQDLYLGLGRVYELTEAWSKAQTIYEAMIAEARTNQVATTECLGLNRLATVYLNGFHDPQQARALLEAARIVADQSGDRRGLAETEWNLSVAARLEQNTLLARHHGEQALAIARELGHPQLMARCLNSLAYVHSRLRQWATVEAYAREARDLYRVVDNWVLEADSQRMIGWSQMYAGRPQDSVITLRETMAFGRQIDNLWGEVESAWRLAWPLLDLGHLGEAIQLARQAARQAPQVGQPMMILLASLTWGVVQRAVMALEPAEETLLAIQKESAEMGLTGFEDWILAELCAVRALAGDWEKAHAYAKQAMQAREDETLLPMSLTSWYETEALLRGGDGALARAEAERLDALAGDNKRYRLVALHCKAGLAMWDTDFDTAIHHLRAAHGLAQEVGYRSQERSILVTLSDLYEEQGDDSAAEETRENAANIARRLAESIDDPDLRAAFLAGNA